MRLDYLGHASWLVEAGALRLAFDPQLFDRHAGGVFQVFPPRTIDARALRPDFVFVSHVHFDHFDVDSLAALARADRQTVLVTSDPLVEEVGRVLGFETVRRLAPGTRVELAEDLVISTTPSIAPDVEWGLLLEHEGSSVWNLIDTVFNAPEDVTAVKRELLGARRLDLALAPIQPMNEVGLATSDRVGFDAAYYRHLLGCGAATEARVLAPSACGEAFRAPFGAMNRAVYPVSRARAVRDFAAFSPGTRALAPELGEALLVEGGEVALGEGGTPITRCAAPEDPRTFRPFEPGPLGDPNPDGLGRDAIWASARRFAADELAPALGRALGGREMRCVLELVFDDGERAALAFDGRGGVEPRFEPEYDVLVSAAASFFCDVIEGRRAWVEPLLAGLLRSSIRGVDVHAGYAAPLGVAPMFPYYALPYRASVERASLRRARAHAGQR